MAEGIQLLVPEKKGRQKERERRGGEGMGWELVGGAERREK